MARDPVTSKPPKRMGRPANSDGTLTRQAVLLAAKNSLAAVGYERMSLDDVAAGAGITRAAIYRYFSSKQDLARETVQAFSPNIEKLYATLSADAHSLADELRAFIIACITNSIEDPTPVLGYYEVARLAAEDSEMARLFRDLSQEVLVKIDLLIADAVDRGEIPADTDRCVIHDTVVGLIWAMAQGAAAAPNERVRSQILLASSSLLTNPPWESRPARRGGRRAPPRPAEPDR